MGETSRLLKFIETGDPLTTNIAFGGDELDTAFITVRLRAATALRLIKDSQLRVADRAGVRAQEYIHAKTTPGAEEYAEPTP